MGSIREAVSGLPAPPLVIGGIGEGGSEQPQRVPRILGTATNTGLPWTLKGGRSGPEIDRPSLDLGQLKINGWRVKLVNCVALGWVPPMYLNIGFNIWARDFRFLGFLWVFSGFWVNLWGKRG